jgi:hypothetical protein
MMEAGLQFMIDDQRMARTIIIELTADPLSRAWRSAMVQATTLSDNDLAVLAGLHNEISALINLRNDWAHGIWWVGYGDDWSKASLDRYKNSAKGMAPPSNLEQPSAEYIEKIASHAAFVSDAIFTFGLIVSSRRNRASRDTHPSDRIQVHKSSGRRMIRISKNGSEWQSSEWPQSV